MRVMVVDDISIAREALLTDTKKVLPNAEVDAFPDGIDAWEAIQKKAYDLLITDISMRRMSGIELAKKVHEAYPNISILFQTGEIESELRRQGVQLERCLFKPFFTEDIREKVDILHELPDFAINPPIREPVEEPFRMELEKEEKQGFFAMLMSKIALAKKRS